MGIARTMLLAVATTLLVAGPPAPLKTPALLPGEGLAVTQGEGVVQAYGAARVEAPMGGLAKLVWMRLEGAEWSSRSIRYRCTGSAGSVTCGGPKGHGRVDLGRGLAADCDLAFLAWIREAYLRWDKDYGEAGGRLRMEEVFAPFLGRRLPPGEGLPPITGDWVGGGDLLRTSPEAFLRWLLEPDKAEVIAFGRRYLAGFWVELNELLGGEPWWFKTATAPVPGEPGATSAWVAGGRGPVLVVLHIPRGTGPEGMARLRAILGLKP